MSKEIKFSEEEMKQVNTIKETYDSLTVQLGQLQLEEMMLTESKDGIILEFKKVREEEKTFADTLSSKYGTGQWNIETGVFVPVE